MVTHRRLKGILTGILTGALAVSVLPGADTPMTDVIVRGRDLAAVAAAVAEHGGSVEAEIAVIEGVAADVPTATLAALRADARTLEVSPDAQVELFGKDLGKDHRGLSPAEAVELLGGRSAARKVDGSNVDVALIDSGVDPELLGRTDVELGIDLSLGDEVGRDGYGHGTAMAGIIAGRGKGFKGVADDARIIDVKIADHRGLADVSQVLAAIDWVVANRDTDGRNIRVLSLSFGTDGTNPASTSPLGYALEAAWRHGIVVVAAAGNHGDELGRLASPAIDPWIIAVGAADVTGLDKHGDGAVTVPAWSARGDGIRDPDLVAPGRSLLGGRSSHSAIATAHPDAAEGDYLLGSGTSQATAFTAGVVAMMLDADPTLTPDRTKALLTATARPLADADPRRAGNGLLDLGALFTDKGELAAVPVAEEQGHRWSDGSGSLDGDRGHFVLEDADGNRLTGDETVVGAFDREAWTDSTWTGSTWTGSTWTGSTWTGSTWTGSTWTSVRWGE